jgi:1-acyl-sn-glycerol-3-phosphate acyltransferase
MTAKDMHFSDEYETESQPASLPARMFPTLCFYARIFAVVREASAMAKKGVYGDEEWVASSCRVLRAVESVGGVVNVQGLSKYATLSGPSVIVANHMSTLETFLLACFLCPFNNLTFVVKRSLTTYPMFGPIMRSRDPVVVDRDNPRKDLQTVLQEGTKRLEQGISIVVFPQTTRSSNFNLASFNSIAVKLARRASVPVVPLALKTDFWGNGRLFKDFGLIRPEKRVLFSFDSPLEITGSGRDEQARICDFIVGRMRDWGVPVIKGR